MLHPRNRNARMESVECQAQIERNEKLLIATRLVDGEQGIVHRRSFFPTDGLRWPPALEPLLRITSLKKRSAKRAIPHRKGSNRPKFGGVRGIALSGALFRDVALASNLPGIRYPTLLNTKLKKPQDLLQDNIRKVSDFSTGPAIAASRLTLLLVQSLFDLSKGQRAPRLDRGGARAPSLESLQAPFTVTPSVPDLPPMLHEKPQSR